MLKSRSKYYYSKLDNDNKSVYDSILSAWEAKNPNASFTLNPLNKNIDIQKALEYIKIDNPGLFYVDFKQISAGGMMGMMSVNANFLYNKKQIDDMEKQIESVIASVLAFKNFNSLDNYGKETVIYDYLVKNVSYSFGVTNDETTSIIGSLLSKKAVCEGYSKAFKLLCDNCGLSGIVVTGKATPQDRQEELHAWNIVKLDNPSGGTACAHVDVTWDSANRGDSDTCYSNFNLTDDDASKDHIWNKALLPACSCPQLNYFEKNGLRAASRDEFINIIKSQAKLGKNHIFVKYTGREVTNEQLMKAANEGLAGIIKPGQRVGFRYSNNRRVAVISLV